MLRKADQLRQPSVDRHKVIYEGKITPLKLNSSKFAPENMGRIPPKRKLPRIFKPSMTSGANLLFVFRGLFQTPEDFSSVLGDQFPPLSPTESIGVEENSSFPREKTVWPPTSPEMEDIYPNHLGCTKYPWNIFYVHLVGGFSPNLFL